jgi:hypothetical protein
MENLLNTSKYIQKLKTIRSQDDEEKLLEDVMEEATIKIQQSEKLTSVLNLIGS